MQLFSFRNLLTGMLAVTLPYFAYAIELSGVIDVRAQREDGERSWTQAAMGKTRYGDGSKLRLGQAILAGEVELSNSFSAVLVLDANDNRRNVVDVQSGWVAWNPVPSGPWKVRAKAGMFFLPVNEEIAYDRFTWTPTRTISASGINSWIGEEFKTKGIELSMTHRGRASGSPHDLGITGAIFDGNDPAGALLAWRGWSIGDRLSGASETLILADLPVYRAQGPINRQTRDMHVFREVDGRGGYYAGVNYSYADTLQLSLLHYDNRGDELVVKGGQYSWATKFNHAGVRLRPRGAWEYLFQYLEGRTGMGSGAVAINYRSWFALASRRLGPGNASVRYDRFRAREHDQIAADPNGESGSALALAYAWELRSDLSVVSEWLSVRSDRAARALVGVAPRQSSTSITTSLRWQF